ncbi:MAG: insulinase family protein [Firmicutes bacterium]|nr:insulinase family protein [Bacillota bacterium]
MAEQADRFVERRLDSGIPFYFLETGKFRTLSLSLFFQRDLRPESVTETALLPEVLIRGSRRHPDLRALNRRLDELYGADLRVTVQKYGEVEAVGWHLDLPDERLLAGAEGLTGEALDLLVELLLEPYMEDGRLSTRYVEQEKVNLARRQQALINDKARYALLRCTQEMFQGEPYALSKLGRPEDLPAIDAGRLTASYEQLLARAPRLLVGVGPGPLARLEEELERRLEALRPRAPGRLEGTRVAVPLEREVRTVVEEQPVAQGKLVLGFRTGIDVRDPDYYPLVVANGVLGGFSHSKLFRNVRERASLAYYAYSSLDPSKGVAFIQAGIEPPDFQRALEIVLEQVEAVRRGEVSEEELETTKLRLASHLRENTDSPDAMIGQALEETLWGVRRSLEERLAAIAAVTREQAVRAFSRVRLDTVYYLTATGQREALGLA